MSATNVQARMSVTTVQARMSATNVLQTIRLSTNKAQQFWWLYLGCIYLLNEKHLTTSNVRAIFSSWN